MTKNEMSKLFALFGGLWPNSKIAKPTKEVSLAWELALEPYPWETMREAVIHFSRMSKFPPDVANLTEACPEVTAEIERQRKGVVAQADWGRYSEKESEARRKRLEGSKT